MNNLALVTAATVFVGLFSIDDRTRAERGEIVISQISDALKAKTSKVADSNLEFQYVVNRQGCILPEVDVLVLKNDKGVKAEVEFVLCHAHSSGEDSFGIAYLKVDGVEFVDWRSEWLNFRSGLLRTRLLDVNDDGVLDFCFVCVRFDKREEILSAYSVVDRRLIPVVAERVQEFEVEFAKTIEVDGLTIRPQSEFNRYCRTNKLYELPVEIINSSSATINMKGRRLWLSDEFAAAGILGKIEVDKLAPRETTKTSLVFRFVQAPSKSNISFELKRPWESQ